MISPNFKLIVKSFIKREDKYLCIQRSASGNRGQHEWDLPGGKVKFGEDIIAALRREVFEEVGLEVKNITPFFTISFMENTRYVVAILYRADYDSGDIVLSKEHENYNWLSAGDLNSVKFQDWIVLSIKDL